MKTLAVFNSNGGVGRTTLVYHIAHMLARLGHRTLAMDLDPQANLTLAFLDEDQVEALWGGGKESILAGLRPLVTGTGDFESVKAIEIADRLFFVPGDPGLNGFEDPLSQSWPGCFSHDEHALRSTTSFSRIIRQAGRDSSAELAIVDVGSSLGAINRAVLLGADFLLVPVAGGLFSLQGLRNLGQTVTRWQAEWRKAAENAKVAFELPRGTVTPIGYVVMQDFVRLDRPASWLAKWAERIPAAYHSEILRESAEKKIPVPDPACLATLLSYRSLRPMAQEARKPMFDLKAADGAIGSYAALVQRCFDDFEKLTKVVIEKCGL
ncbi:MAG: ParA family protein [Myxococcales bacterium]